jgi:hypothetical protein
MQDARRVGPTDSSWDIFIRRAEDKLSEARQLVSGPQEAALVEFNLGIVWLAMGHQGNASHHLELSAACATRVVNEYVRKASYALEDARPSPVRPRFSRTAVRRVVRASTRLVGIPEALGAPKIAAERHTCNDLKDYIGFYNLIQRTASGASGDVKPQYLILDGPRLPGLLPLRELPGHP